ncbi:uncharacterized protein [Spinacia oleracea]|uniref:Uncharacterized protein isoform X2 n=1 Tax=Spinacia oleracea TaxID=3562 RepID=A0A9R0IKP5_SPIOL|nr:uncharacterized protein LOC110789899 isoform X2 [Spinacia oleracea]
MQNCRMLNIPPIITISTFPRIKTTHFQQINNKPTSIFSNHYPQKQINCKKNCFYSTNFIFSSISRVFLKWTFSCFHGNLPKMASCIIVVYLFVLSPEVNAQDHSSFPVRYACEDVKSYYASIDHLKGKALSRKLNSIIAGHHSLSYKKVWDALEILDAADVDKPEASPVIVEIYSARVVPKLLAGKPEGWNMNSSRGNKYFGECQVGLTHCMRPANKEAASDTETDMKIWAPPQRVRGDVARAVMYMAIRYGFHQPGEGPVLHLSDSPSMVKKKMGQLSIILKWNELDPPSKEEKARNERVCRLYQHNRNPFVDHPEYANLIWNQSQKSSSNTSKLWSSIQQLGLWKT